MDEGSDDEESGAEGNAQDTNIKDNTNLGGFKAKSVDHTKEMIDALE